MAKKGRKIDYYSRKAVMRGGDKSIMVGAIDVETEGLGGRLLMCQWGIMNQVFTDSGPDMVANMFDFVLQYAGNVVWYSHFAQYDWRYFMVYLTERGYPIEIGMRTETDIYEIRITNADGDQVILRDSYALFNSPLAKLASSFCPELPKLSIDIEHFNPHDPEHIEYAKRDVWILLIGLPRLFDLIKEHFGIDAGATTAGTALRAWQATLKEDEIYNASEFGAREDFVRQAYYGGIVFMTTNKPVQKAWTVDVNSSYPSVMDDYGVPYGRAIESVDWQNGSLGVYRCRVRAPLDLVVAILPARNDKGGMRWYSGEFETVVTNIEMEFAVAHGYEILEVYEGIYYEETVFPFHDFIAKCKFLRFNFRDLPEEMLAKLMQNSLYGKYGTRRQRLRMMSAMMMTDEDFIGAMPYDEDGLWYVIKEVDQEMLCMPEWATFITARARLKLLTAVYAIGPTNAIYGDTDSITFKDGFAHLIDIGLEYGQWKLEKEWQVFRAIAPKVYSGILADGKWKGAAKGLPRKGITDVHWKLLLEDGKASATTLSLPSLRVAMKTGVKPARQLTRRSSDLRNSSNFVADLEGNVRTKTPDKG